MPCIMFHLRTLGTAAWSVKLLMSKSVELEAVSVTVSAVSDCWSQWSVRVKPSFSYTVTAGAVGTGSAEGK